MPVHSPVPHQAFIPLISFSEHFLCPGCWGLPLRSSQTSKPELEALPKGGFEVEEIAEQSPEDVYPQGLWMHTWAP